MKIGLDIDGVLTNIETYQLEKGKEFFKKKYNKEIINPNGYDISEIFDCSSEEFKEFWTKYLFDYSIKLPARKGASEFTKSIHNSGDKIIIITSRIFADKNDKKGKLMRFIVEEWLKHNKIEYDEIEFCSENKSEVVKKHNIDIMFEDSPKNIEDLSKITNVICVEAGYNKSVKANNRIVSMDKALKEVVKIKNEINRKNINDRSFNEIKPLFGKASVDKPWMKYYSYDERKIKLPHMSVYDYLYTNNKDNMDMIALNYYDKKITYKELFEKIDKYAKSFLELGVNEGEIVSLCLPNIPEAIYMFYALNKIGAVANMIHPLKSANEIKELLNGVDSKKMVLIDNAHNEINNIIDKTSVEKAIVVSAGDSMPLPMKLVYKAKTKNNIDYSNNSVYIKLDKFLSEGKKHTNIIQKKSNNSDSIAAIIYTGGSTGIPKGVELTNDNFNCMVHQQKATAKNFGAGEKMLTIMPVFHGFGLCSSIHMPLSYGITSILIPKFSAKDFQKLISKYKPNHIFGVPKLWKAFIDNKEIQKMDLSFIKYIVSGGENIKKNLEEDINEFLVEHGCSSKIKKGYGLSEAVAGTTLSDDYSNEIGSVGIPLICNNFKIVKPGTQEELDYNTEGEFCITGPTIMKEYFNNENETDLTLQKHSDGKIWLHTGDMGYITEDGIIYYTDRLTRMYVSSGFNIYPPRIEKIIENVEEISSCAVVPMNHPYKDIKVPKVYVILKDGFNLNDSIIKKISNECSKNLDAQHQPYKFEQLEEFPLTNMGDEIGKINYKELENMANGNSKIKQKRR